MVLSGYVRPVAFCGIFGSAFMVVVQSFYFIKQFEMNFFLQYSPLYFVSCYVSKISYKLNFFMFSLIFQILITNMIYPVVLKIFFDQLKLCEQLFAVNIEEASQQTKRKIYSTIKRIEVVFVVQILSGCLAIMINMYYFNLDRNKYFVISLVLSQYIDPGKYITIVLKKILLIQYYFFQNHILSY